MRAEAGFLAAQLLLLATGLSGLYALGMVALRPRRVLAALGPAYLAGIAIAIPAMIVLLLVGVRLETPTLAVLCIVITAALSVVGRRGRQTVAPRGPLARRERIAVIVAAATAGAWAVWAGGAFDNLPIQLDDARIWSLKSFALFHFGHLEQHVFTGAAYGGSHLDYPILQPVLQASIYRSMGTLSPAVGHVELWIVVVAAVWTMIWVLARPGHGIVWLIPLGLLLVAPGIYTNVKLGYADATYSCFLAAGALMIGRWLETSERSLLLLGAVMLGAAANLKNEGTVAAVLIVACGGAVTLAPPGDRRARIRGWLPAPLVVLALAAPWRIWVAAQGIGNSDQPPFSEALGPSYLFGRTDRLPATFSSLFGQLASPRWYLFFAALVVLAVTALVARRATRLAAFYLATVALLGLSLVYAYWTSLIGVEFHLATSIDRTVTGMLVVSAVGLAHLLGSLTAGRTDPTDATSSSEGLALSAQ